MVRMFGPAGALTIAALVAAAFFGGLPALIAVLVLTILEVSLSFDNAVVNAKVLGRMSLGWQKVFLTVGILIAVVGMRLVLPIVIVAVTSHMALNDVVNLALHNPDEYAHHLEGAKDAIHAFGGIFLEMIFLDFALDTERDIHWLAWLEKPLAKIGKLDQFSVVLALLSLYGAYTLADASARISVLVSGLFGLTAYLAISSINNLMEDEEEENEDEAESAETTPGVAPTNAKKVSFGAGLATFLYLEMLDASFSMDGVIGAFAISTSILVIALGLGIGSFWVRSMTIYLVRTGVLKALVYLEHGAHWAIGVLAIIMLLGVKYDISEYVTGASGALFVIAAALTSVVEKKREAKREEAARAAKPVDIFQH